MKILVTFFASLIVAISYAEGESFSGKIARAFGAKAKVVFRVVDDEGNPVEGAKVDACFYMNKRKGNPRDEGFTDKDGLCALEEKTVNEVTYTVSKEGYYETNGRLWFGGGRGKPAIVKWGKWQPYGKTYAVTLLPEKKPIQLIAYFFNGDYPAKSEVGFDLRMGDYVKPYGEGCVADFYLNVNLFTNGVNGRVDREVRILFPKPLDGVYRKNKKLSTRDMKSNYQTCYTANTNAIYQKEMVFTLNSETDTTLKDEEYLVLRTRTKTDEKGRLIEAYYSKILGTWSIGAHAMYFFAYINSTPNDCNLEFDRANPILQKPNRK